MISIRSAVGAAALVLVCGLAASTIPSASAEPVQMVFGIAAQLPTSPKSAIPGTIPTSGTVGSVADPRFTNFGTKINRSATSNLWVTVATTNLTPTSADQVLLIGNGLNLAGGAVAAREGVTGSNTGDLINFSGLAIPRVNDSGQWALAFRPASAPAGGDRLVRSEASGIVTVAQSGTSIGAIPGSTFGGNFSFGSNPFSSAFIATSGALSFMGTVAPSTTASTGSIFGADGATLIINNGVDTPGAQGAGAAAPWASISAFTQNADATRWLALGKVGTNTAVDVSVVVDGSVKVQKGFAISNSSFTSPVSTISDAFMESSGDWYARGANGDNTQWIVRNGSVVAVTGTPVSAGATEQWRTFIDVRGNNAGNYVIVGTTDASDTTLNNVLVLNGQRVIARSSDPVDVNADGTFAGSLFLHTTFQPSGVLNNDGYYYFFNGLKASATATTGAGGTNNRSLLRVRACPSDYNGTGATNVQDIFDFLAGWFAGAPLADFNRGGGITVQDIFDFLSAWFTGC